MTEVPEHLLQRSRERREALGLATTGGSAPAGPESGAVEVAASSPAPTAAAPPAAPPPPTIPEYVPPPPPPRKSRVPMWVMPVLAIMPFWAILYAGAFADRSAPKKADPGAGVYRSAGCSGCHGAQGQGGVGPPLASVKLTFPDEAQHISWIKTGSKSFAGQPYGAQGKIATGGMPGFGDSLDEEQIKAIVAYERNTLAR